VGDADLRLANPAPGTAALNLAYTYNKCRSLQFRQDRCHGRRPDVLLRRRAVRHRQRGGGGSGFTPITFASTTLTYTLTALAGPRTPRGGRPGKRQQQWSAKVVKSAAASCGRARRCRTGANQSSTRSVHGDQHTDDGAGDSPRAGIPVRLKVEDAADVTRTVETEAMTTLSNAWETLTFDFANQVPGTAALNLAYTYNKVSISSTSARPGAAGRGGTFYFDEVRLAVAAVAVAVAWRWRWRQQLHADHLRLHHPHVHADRLWRGRGRHGGGRPG